MTLQSYRMLRYVNGKHEQTYKQFCNRVSEDDSYVMHMFILHIHCNRRKDTICVCVSVCTCVKISTGFVALLEFPLQFLDLVGLEGKIISTSTCASFKRVTCLAVCLYQRQYGRCKARSKL